MLQKHAGAHLGVGGGNSLALKDAVCDTGSGHKLTGLCREVTGTLTQSAELRWQ